MYAKRPALPPGVSKREKVRRGICLASYSNPPRPRGRRLGLLIAKKSTTKDEDEDEKDGN
jgi:hypothetical protein